MTLISLLDRSVAIGASHARRYRLTVFGNGCLLVVFTLVTTRIAIGAAVSGTFALDLRIYRAAAQALFAGENPWNAGVLGITFAAPPPTLIAYIPAGLLPEPLAIALYGAISLVAAAATLRALSLPFWWLLFPPLSEGLMQLNPDVVVIALLVRPSPLAGLAMVMKIYAALPLLLGERWRALFVGVGLCLLSAPLWPQFLEAAGTVALALPAQSGGGLSAAGTWLLVPVVISLVYLWRRGAEWLAVPAIWPYAQFHYSTLALPVAARNFGVALLLCAPIAMAAPIATLYYAAFVFLSARLAAYRTRAKSLSNIALMNESLAPVKGGPNLLSHGATARRAPERRTRLHPPKSGSTPLPSNGRPTRHRRIPWRSA
jgi:hypothetical protein